MVIYFSETSMACYPEEFKDEYEASGSWPADGVLIDSGMFERFFLSAPPPGCKLGVREGKPGWVTDPEYEIALENGWIQQEMSRTAEEILKAQDSDPTAVGTEADWRAYRVALRAWPENEHFPNKNYRPMAPDAE